MKKFEHFTAKEIDVVCRKAQFRDGKYNGFLDVLLLDFYEETALNIINRALDEHLVERVIGDKSQDGKKVKIGSNEYTLKMLPDGKVWMENLREKVEGAVWNEYRNCYLYTFEQAQKAVPDGYHLPSARELMDLCLTCGYLKKSNDEVAKKLQDDCGFVTAGWADDSDGICDYSITGNYWSSTSDKDRGGFYLAFGDISVYLGIDTFKKNKYAVRCIKNDGKE